jgi:hypothetical protein
MKSHQFHRQQSEILRQETAILSFLHTITITPQVGMTTMQHKNPQGIRWRYVINYFCSPVINPAASSQLYNSAFLLLRLRLHICCWSVLLQTYQMAGYRKQSNYWRIVSVLSDSVVLNRIRSPLTYGSRNTSVGIATRLRSGRQRFYSRWGQEIFVYSTAPKRALGLTERSILWVWGKSGLSREDDHTPPSSAEVKNDGFILPHPHTSSWCSS